MTEITKVLVEQTLFGMNDEPLHGEDYLIESLCQYIDNIAPTYTMDEVLRESIETSDLYSKYIPLLEAVDDIKNAEKELKQSKETNDEVKKDKFFTRCGNSIKKAIEWYYRVDPQTQAKNLRLILKIVQLAVVFVLRWKLLGGKSAIQTLPADAISSGVKGIGKKVAGKLPEGMKGALGPKEMELSKKAHTDIGTPIKIKERDADGKVIIGSDGKALKTKMKIRINWCGVVLNAVNTAITKLDKEAYYHINLKDLDENIKKYDKMVNEFNLAIDEEEDDEIIRSLKKGRQAAENALRDLMLVREERSKREAKKDLLSKKKDSSDE